MPLSALPAWQALFDHGNLRRGQRLLVARAARGTGVFAVQFALHIGAEELSAITELIKSGKVIPFVGKTFGLENVQQAFKDESFDYVRGKANSQCCAEGAVGCDRLR